MISIDFGLLRGLYCKISYLLAEEHWSHTNLGIWQPRYDSVCKDNSWIHGKCRQRFLSNVYKRFFFKFSPRFFTFLTFFLNFHLNVYYIYGLKCNSNCRTKIDRFALDYVMNGNLVLFARHVCVCSIIIIARCWAALRQFVSITSRVSVGRGGGRSGRPLAVSCLYQSINQSIGQVRLKYATASLDWRLMHKK